MADEKLPKFSEDDDMARVRVFWKENGKPIVFGVGFGLVGIAGFNYWQYYERQQGENASILYEQVLSGVEADEAVNPGEALKAQSGSTVYASLGAFSRAKALVEDRQYEAAISQLQWVLENSGDERIRHIARLRLALVYIADGNTQSALEILAVADMGNFEARYQELRGDAYIKRNQEGDSDLARSAYQNSLEKADSGGTDRDLLQLKLQNVGES